jgi:hypothetical protein
MLALQEMNQLIWARQAISVEMVYGRPPVARIFTNARRIMLQDWQ